MCMCVCVCVFVHVCVRARASGHATQLPRVQVTSSFDGVVRVYDTRLDVVPMCARAHLSDVC